MSSQFWIIFFTIFTFFSCTLPPVRAQTYNFPGPTANLSTSWINTVSANGSFSYIDNSTIATPILLRSSSDNYNTYSYYNPNYPYVYYYDPNYPYVYYNPNYVCGFYCNGTYCDSYLFAIFLVDAEINGDITSLHGPPQVVWSANRNNPVRTNATLELTAEGDLVLRDADGTLAWSTDTGGKAVAGLNLTEIGNLVLFDANDSVVWQSFDHPTDCLVLGQILVSGKNLTVASASSTNWSEGGLFSASMTEEGLVASIQSDPPQVYYKISLEGTKQNKEASYAKFNSRSLDLYINRVEPLNPDISTPIPRVTSAQYMKLGPDGHLRVFDDQWVSESTWKEVADIFTPKYGDCGYPMVCGKYGICSNEGCSCPSGASFRQESKGYPNLYCSEVIPLTCNASNNHRFLDLENVTYFYFTADISDIDMNSCKEACLKNCSCKAAIFRYGSNSSVGDCYLPSQIFSLMNNERDLTKHNTSVSIKIQIASPGKKSGKTSLLRPILGLTLGVFCIAVVIGTTVFIYQRRRKSEDVKEDYLDHVPGTRFSFEELATATHNFNKKLGEGGFGSVFEGLLNDGTRIAVKRLNGVGHVKKSFLAEVETIASSHHINLVRLIGFCTEQSQRLLVYEYMCNGSLERWIYCRSHETMLDWNYRRKIILDIAKGLAYLHEECSQKIIHLDIKPQNILLDEYYNAKLADFGLSKLVDKNQSKVVTNMRGTPGYLAPEWRSAVITEKVDVYSFGVLILEIICGRKVFEQSRPEEERHLPTLFMKKAEEGQWLDLVDKCCQDVESNIAEVEEMMKISAWCLQSDHKKRPSMSVVIKILEGVKDVQKDIGFNFLIPEVDSQDVTRLLPSLLSGPR